jgi:glycosyltransferase involved in cell wall biosynthesis
MLPTHNRADVIGFAIRSVLWQTEADWELLIAGDGCTDNTADVVAWFDDPRIRWFDLPKAPLSGYANRNFVLREARGEFIAYAQHDDIFFPDHLNRLASTIERHGAMWGYSRPLWIEPDGFIAPFAIDLTRPDDLAAFRQGNYIPSCCVLHRRSVFATAGYWPEDVPSVADWVLWNRIIDAGGADCIAYCAEPTVLHFRAAWKTSAAYDMPAVRRLAELADQIKWWPSIYRLAVPPGRSEQEIVFQRMAADEAFCAGLRDAATEVYQRISWAEVK